MHNKFPKSAEYEWFWMRSSNTFGPEGTLSREEWRDICIREAKRGAERWSNWQEENKKLYEALVASGSRPNQISLPYSQFEDYKPIFPPYLIDLSGWEELDISFENFTFHQPVFAAETTFTQPAFELASFNSVAIFRTVSFARQSFTYSSLGLIYFLGCDFNGPTSFRGTFNRPQFTVSDCLFRKEVDFGGNLAGMTTVTDTVFEKRVTIGSKPIHQTIPVALMRNPGSTRPPHYSEASLFSGPTTFERCTFKNQFQADDAIFEERACFAGSHFQGAASFKGVEFQANFSEDYPNNGTDSEGCDFRNCNFQSHADFRAKTFALPPLLNGSTGVEHVTFNPNKIPLLNRLGYSDRYRLLKQIAKSQGDTDTELKMGEYEMLTRAEERSDDWSLRLFTCAYSRLSNFGQSPGKPIVFLIAATLFVFVALMSYSSWPYRIADPAVAKHARFPIEQQVCVVVSITERCTELSAIRAGYEYIVQQGLAFLPGSKSSIDPATIRTRLFGEPTSPFFFRLLELVYSAFAFLTIFLSALGLRNLFRMR